MIASGSGAIVNVGSEAGLRGSAAGTPYSTSKHAVNGFTPSTAFFYTPKGIRCNAVAPGPVWTPLQVSDGQPTEKLNGFGESSWLGRTSQPVEQAPAYVFLASPESSFVVGEVINVNGGANVP